MTLYKQTRELEIARDKLTVSVLTDFLESLPHDRQVNVQLSHTGHQLDPTMVRLKVDL